MDSLRSGWAVAFLAALAACGGGGGSSGQPESHVSSALAITASPTAPVAGATFGVTVEVRDSAGQKVASGAAISLALQGPGVLHGTLSAAAVQGIATFADLSITQAGAGYRVVATASGLTQATSTAFAVVPAAASRLAFTVEPFDAAVATTITPAVQVAVEDAFGNVVTASTATVSLALNGGTAGAALAGGGGRAAASGLATFDALDVDLAGTTYTLTAAASGLTSATSNAFTITPFELVLLAAAGGSGSLGAAYSPGTGWSAVALTGGASAAPAVALTSSCTGVALRRAAGDALEAATWSGSGWSPFASVAAGVTTNAAPALAAGGSGVQSVYRGTDYKLYAATYTGAWSPTVEAVGGTGASQIFTASAPSLAVLSGDAVVTYAHDSSQLPTACTRTVGSWGSPVSFAALDPVAASAPVAVVAPSSGPELLAVWQGSSGSQLLFATRSGGTWSGPSAITGAAILGGDLPALAPGAAGAVMLAFRGTDGKYYWTQYSGSAWSTPASLAIGTLSPAQAPAVASGIAGADYELVFAGTDGAAYHSRFSAGAWSAPALVGGTGLTWVALTSGSCGSAP